MAQCGPIQSKPLLGDAGQRHNAACRMWPAICDVFEYAVPVDRAGRHDGARRLRPGRGLPAGDSTIANGSRPMKPPDMFHHLGGQPGPSGLASGRVVAGEQRQGDVDRRAPREQAGTHLFERLGDGLASVGEHEDETFGHARSSQVVHQAQAGVVRLMQVVDRQQCSSAGCGEPDQLSNRDVQPLVSAVAAPVQHPAGQRPLDVVAAPVVQAVEQRGVASTQIRDGVEDGCVRPVTLDFRCHAGAGPPTLGSGLLPQPVGEERLADTTGAGEEGGLAAAVPCLLGDLLELTHLLVAAHDGGAAERRRASSASRSAIDSCRGQSSSRAEPFKALVLA